jgi:membrane protein implicated in regulation of membrane protease activity
MASLFWLALFAGVGTLLLQVIVGALGHDHGLGDHDDVPAEEGLDLLSVRALASGVAAFGVTGLAIMRAGAPSIVALGAAIVVALAAAAGVAWIIRQLMRLEEDGSMHLESAVGKVGTVAVPIPAHGEHAGKVRLAVEGRWIEWPATTRGPALPTGAPVLVLELRDDRVLDVCEAPAEVLPAPR